MQAIMIVAHKDPDQVLELCKLLKKTFNVYVHFDSKCHLSDDKVEKFKNAGINIYSHYSVNWGSYNICKVELLLLKEALKNKDNTYFHLISGQVWPTDNIKSIEKFYSENKNIYLTYKLTKDIFKEHEYVIWWYKFYYFYDRINRRSLFGKIIHRVLIYSQRLLHINKLKILPKNMELYCGSQWFGIPRYCAEYCVNCIDNNPWYEKFFSTSFCSDEAFFQTIILNSPMKDKVVPNNHRYILWKNKHNSRPAILDTEDIETVQKGDYHFARKIDPKFSREFMDAFSDK